MKSGWCFGHCERTGAKGDFPAECVYVLPTLSKPPPAILVSAYGGGGGSDSYVQYLRALITSRLRQATPSLHVLDQRASFIK